MVGEQRVLVTEAEGQLEKSTRCLRPLKAHQTPPRPDEGNWQSFKVKEKGICPKATRQDVTSGVLWEALIRFYNNCNREVKV